MSKDTQKEIDFELGLCRISSFISDEMKAVKEKYDCEQKSQWVPNFFSSPLQQQVLMSNHGDVPSIMFQCIEQIQKRGITEEGIFRRPGNNNRIQEARQQLQDGKKVNFDKIDIRTVASILKLWLRELPTPLIPFSYYSKLIALGGTVKQVTEQEKMACMGKVKREIVTIPNPEKNCLRALMIFLHNIAKKFEVNKMHPKNLAIVMAPNLLYRKLEEANIINAQRAVQEMAPAIEIITLLIQNVDFFFKDNHEDKS